MTFVEVTKIKAKFWWCRFKWKLHHILLQYHAKAAKYHLDRETDIVAEVHTMSNDWDALVKKAFEEYEKLKGREAEGKE